MIKKAKINQAIETLEQAGYIVVHQDIYQNSCLLCKRCKVGSFLDCVNLVPPDYHFKKRFWDSIN